MDNPYQEQAAEDFRMAQRQQARRRERRQAEQRRLTKPAVSTSALSPADVVNLVNDPTAPTEASDRRLRAVLLRLARNDIVPEGIHFELRPGQAVRVYPAVGAARREAGTHAYVWQLILLAHAGRVLRCARLECGRLLVRRGRRRYCSRRCANQVHYAGRRKGSKPAATSPKPTPSSAARECPWCRGFFTLRKRPNRRYCSPLHGARYRAEAQRERQRARRKRDLAGANLGGLAQ
jgi:hypothetical protein